MSRAVKQACRLLHSAIEKHRLIEDGETVIVGFSGGADSLCLLHLLAHYSSHNRKNWHIVAVHVDPGFPEWNSTRIERLCRSLELSCTVIKLDIPGRTKTSTLNPCHVCSRERRKALFETAARLGARRIALAHHMEDVNETLLMNLLYTASLAAILPCQSLFKGRLDIIRPLYYFDKPLIRACLRQQRLRPVRLRCPHERTSARVRLRRFLERLYRQNRRIRTNLFWGLHNPKPDYLPTRGRPHSLP
uniref:tRNA 2-thiocytidine biosynthesis protein TtcA n=1 Tax=candidate division WOR-3 bacterium TaxID=2052148 RepID=A0A7C4CCK5_UNCW3